MVLAEIVEPLQFWGTEELQMHFSYSYMHVYMFPHLALGKTSRGKMFGWKILQIIICFPERHAMQSKQIEIAILE